MKPTLSVQLQPGDLATMTFSCPHGTTTLEADVRNVQGDGEAKASATADGIPLLLSAHYSRNPGCECQAETVYLDGGEDQVH